MKIISLVPSLTELLFDLGLKDQIIGRTKFCVHPDPEVKLIPQFGGTKNLHINRIMAANPDLIIANKEENLKEEIEILQQHFQVLVTDISDLQQNNDMILQIGELTNTTGKAREIVSEINSEFSKIPAINLKPSVLYLIWKAPLMSVGSDTFIHHMLKYAGFKNISADSTRYPVIDEPEKLNPEFVFLSSEPFPFSEKHIPEIQKIFPEAKIIHVDGEMFSWYGSRMRLAPVYFLKLGHELQLY